MASEIQPPCPSALIWTKAKALATFNITEDDYQSFRNLVHTALDSAQLSPTIDLRKSSARHQVEEVLRSVLHRIPPSFQRIEPQETRLDVVWDLTRTTVILNRKLAHRRSAAGCIPRRRRHTLIVPENVHPGTAQESSLDPGGLEQPLSNAAGPADAPPEQQFTASTSTDKNAVVVLSVEHTSHASINPSPSATSGADGEGSRVLFYAELSRYTDDTCHSLALSGSHPPTSVSAGLKTDSKLDGDGPYQKLPRMSLSEGLKMYRELDKDAYREHLSQIYLTAQHIGTLPDGAMPFSACSLADLSTFPVPSSTRQLQFDKWLYFLTKDLKYDPRLHRISDSPHGTRFITNEQSWRKGIHRRTPPRSKSKIISFFIHSHP